MKNIKLNAFQNGIAIVLANVLAKSGKATVRRKPTFKLEPCAYEQPFQVHNTSTPMFSLTQHYFTGERQVYVYFVTFYDSVRYQRLYAVSDAPFFNHVTGKYSNDDPPEYGDLSNYTAYQSEYDEKTGLHYCLIKEYNATTYHSIELWRNITGTHWNGGSLANLEIPRNYLDFIEDSLYG